MASYSWNKWMLIRAVVIGVMGFWWSSTLSGQIAVVVAQSSSPAAIGTWKGESICVGDRPACKNEVVVYRLEPLAGKPEVVTLFADKIIDGKREPMGKLDFQYDEAKGTLTCEFTRRQTHGLWQFKLTGDEMEGTLELLPEKSIGRRVKVKRVRDDAVPQAPARELY